MTKYLRYLVTGLAGAILLVLAPDFSSAADKRVALIVGNSAYRNVARLPNPEKDAAAIAKLFRDAGFNTVVEANNVGNLDFKRAIRKFEDSAADADIAVVFYAGHGIEVGGTNYLVPVDAKLASDRDAEDEAISLNRLVESVDGAKRLRLIMLDACRDDPFVATMKRVRRTAMRAISSGLGKVEPTSTDTLIAYAAKAGSTAEDGEGTHSPFTTALLANLTVPGLDVRLAFGRIRDDVLKITSHRQEPFVYGSLGGGNISLVPAPEKPAEPEITKVKTDYELVAQIGTKKAWEVFLSTYKSGFYADLARAQLAKLTTTEPAPTASPPKVVASLGPTPPPEPAKPTSDELRAWNRIRDSSDKNALENFIKQYPNSPLAVNAQHRLDVLDRAAREREEKARAERETAKRADEERHAKEAARLAELQRIEDEKRAKEAARIAALKAENERRAKEIAESEKQKKEQAERITALQAEIDRRAKELAESEKKKAALGCQREQERLEDLNSAGNSASVREDLKRLSQNLTCERLRPQVVAAIDRVTAEINKAATPKADTPVLIASAQKELTRLGCFTGSPDGKLDAATKVAIKKYKVTKGEAVSDVSVTEGFVSELSKEKLRVCSSAIADKPEAKPDRKEAKQERNKAAKTAKERPQPQARQQARAGSSSSHPAMIGIGF